MSEQSRTHNINHGLDSQEWLCKLMNILRCG